MQEFFSNKRNLIILFVVIVALLILSWFLMPSRQVVVNERFDLEIQRPMMVQEMPMMVQDVPMAVTVSPLVQVQDVQVPQMLETSSYDNVMPFEYDNELMNSMYFLDDGNNGNATIVNNPCSKSCCPNSWPTPFKQKADPYICEMKAKGELVPSGMFCNNSVNNSGCLCLRKDQAQGIMTRNNNTNGSPWY